MRFNSYDLAGPDPKPMTKGEVTVLKELVKRTFPDRPERPSATIFSIDINPCESEFENLRKAGLGEHGVIRLLGRSQDIGVGWPFEVDFIWVDGDHSYHGVSGDIRAWFPRLISGGVIAFHDYFEGPPPKHNPSGAGRAVRELMGDHELVASFERIRAFKK